jgi:hypothetical protein
MIKAKLLIKLYADDVVIAESDNTNFFLEVLGMMRTREIIDSRQKKPIPFEDEAAS